VVGVEVGVGIAVGVDEGCCSTAFFLGVAVMLGVAEGARLPLVVWPSPPPVTTRMIPTASIKKAATGRTRGRHPTSGLLLTYTRPNTHNTTDPAMNR
jgi:hypothetical protein